MSEVEHEWLDFLKDGETSREDVLVELGVPTARFEGDRILSYRMDLVGDRGLVPVPASMRGEHIIGLAGDYHLILVFDDRSILSRHKLLQP